MDQFYVIMTMEPGYSPIKVRALRLNSVIIKKCIFSDNFIGEFPW